MPPTPSRLSLVPRSLAARVDDIEVALLVEGVFRRYGFDFRPYAPDPLRRRILEHARAEQLPSVSRLQERVLRDRECFERLVTTLSDTGCILFQNPAFFSTFRREVAPRLRTRSRPRLWHLGCSTGAEIYSMAVVLEEEGLHDAVRVYATEVSDGPLRQAAAGSFPLERLRAAELSYRAAGGKARLADYYRTEGGQGVFRPRLRDQVVFASHNIGTDASFNEFDVVVCRNVMPRLGQALRSRVHRLVYDSLATSGYIGLGRGEDMRHTPFELQYEPVGARSGLFRKRT